MKIYKESWKSDNCIFDVTCDICGSSCRICVGRDANGDSINNVCNAELKIDGYYGGNYDMLNLKCDMCEKCFDRVKGFIIGIGGSIREEYSRW